MQARILLQIKDLQRNSEEAYRILQETFLRLAKEKLSSDQWFTIAATVYLEIREALSLEADRCTEVGYPEVCLRSRAYWQK